MHRLVLIILCIVLLVVPVAAANEVTSIQGSAVVTSDGSCQVSMSVKLHLDEDPGKLTFPIPVNARAVSVNGKRTSAGKQGNVRQINLSKFAGGAGEYLLNLQYTLNNLVRLTEDDTHVLELPLLCGFSGPISGMEFTVSLPGNIQARPTFTSGYLQESVEEQLSFTYSGATISGVVDGQLKDHETLSMALEVPAEQFPSVQTRITSSAFITNIFAWIFAGLALLYWILFLRCLPVWPSRTPMPPDGFCAGELGSRLTMAGADLTMMVIHWARLGYLVIQLDDNGRVLLYKRMDMGNERSKFENHCFRSLFGNRKMVDGTGCHYARMCRKVAAAPNKGHGMYRASSGSPKIFRCFALAVGVFWGISMAVLWVQTPLWQTLLGVALAIFAGVVSHTIQKGCQYLYLRNRLSLYLALSFSAVWIILGFITETPGPTTQIVFFQFLAGLAVSYGGRRTETGRQTMQQILDLRRYLRTISSEEVQRIEVNNPDYFFEMLPYALALGVDRSFARRFGNQKMPDCTYLISRMNTSMNAAEWDSLFRDAAQALDERQKQIPWDRIFGSRG